MNPVVSPESLVVCFDAQAGHAYVTRSVPSGTQGWVAIVHDRNTHGPVPADCASPDGDTAAGAGSPIVIGSNGQVETPAAPVAPMPGPGTSATIMETRADADSGERRPGTGLYLRSGFAFGGDTLVTAQLSNGDERSLDAGGGASLSIGARVTPLWIRKRVGFGGGLEVGWKLDRIRASNGGASIDRFPAVASAHMLMRVARRSFLRAGAGFEKHLGVNLEADGVFGMVDVNLRSTLGQVVELGHYRLHSRHVATEVLFRYTHVRYTFVGGSVDGSNGSLSVAVHYNP